jgi:hypothetical protein
MADAVDASVNAMQATSQRARSNRVVAKAEALELDGRDHAVLPCG